MEKMSEQSKAQHSLTSMTGQSPLHPVAEHIVNWLEEYRSAAGMRGYVVGVSGGVDSALTSTLCALTNAPLVVLSMPIRQSDAELNRAGTHCQWLQQISPHVKQLEVPLGAVFTAASKALPADVQAG